MKFYLVCFLLLKVTLVFADTEEWEEDDSDINTRIMGGAPDSSGRFRNIVKLNIFFQNDEREVYCTGVLIHPTSVLTAARCVRWLGVTANRVRGSLSYTKGSKLCIQKFMSSRIHVHDQYTSSANDQDGEYKDYDIAIVKINPKERPIGANPARLPQEKLRNKPEDYWNKGLLLAGWGNANSDGETNVEVAAVTGYSRCINDEPKITERQICTANGDTVMLCQNDSFGMYDYGAPLFDTSKGRAMILIGVGSSSSPQCDKDPSIFTFVPRFLSWIKNILRQREYYNRDTD